MEIVKGFVLCSTKVGNESMRSKSPIINKDIS